MAEKKDWFPGGREGQLTMAKNWTGILTGQGPAWGVPEAVTQGFTTLTTQADGVLAAARNETTRTPVVNAHCREIFGNLEDNMRDIKRRYFLVPPLTEADLIALGLKPHDTIHTPSGPPTAHVAVETYLVGRHELGVRIVYIDGSPDDPANKGYRVYYRVVAPGEAPPENPEIPGAFPLSFYTKRRKDVVVLGYGDSGKTAYFAVQIENDGKKGPWGPIVSAIIP